MGRTTGSDGAKTAQAIVKAATALIARIGFQAVTLRQIAGEVGIQAGSIYRYFPSKDDLLYVIVKQHLHDLLEAWRASPAAPDNGVAALRQFVGFHVKYHFDKHDEIFISNAELRNLAAPYRDEIYGLRHAYEAIPRQILIAGQADGVFMQADPTVTTYAILSMLTGLFAWYKKDGRLSEDEIITLHADLVCTGVLAGRTDKVAVTRA